ncbi:MAG: thioredoxin family protein, partial [Planctomycetes bacterium]|nr:thioredoxin family protein [Planctomycetota bacterium]
VIPAVAAAGQLDRALAETNRPVLVDFYTPNCPACRRLAPVFAAVARRYKGRADFLRVDLRAVPQLAERYDIRAVPVVIMFVNARQVRRWLGVQDEEAFRSALDAAVEKPRDAAGAAKAGGGEAAGQDDAGKETTP